MAQGDHLSSPDQVRKGPVSERSNKHPHSSLSFWMVRPRLSLEVPHLVAQEAPAAQASEDPDQLFGISPWKRKLDPWRSLVMATHSSLRNEIGEPEVGGIRSAWLAWCSWLENCRGLGSILRVWEPPMLRS